MDTNMGKTLRMYSYQADATHHEIRTLKKEIKELKEEVAQGKQERREMRDLFVDFAENLGNYLEEHLGKVGAGINNAVIKPFVAAMDK